MTNKQQQIPAIRFNGFTDTWGQRKSKEICTISTGKGNTQDKIDDGKYPFYVRSATIERSNDYLYDQEAVLTVGDGVGTGKVFHYVNGKYNLHQRVYRMFDFNNEVSAKYFYYYFSKKFYRRVMAMTAKTSVDSVRLEMIADMIIEFPSPKEQQKIVKLFESLDDAIALHQRQLDNYKELKKVMLQKIFNQEFRFKDEYGNNYPEWEEVELKELGGTFTGLTGKTKENFGKGTGKFVTYMNVFSNPIANLTMTENVEIKDGEKQNEVRYGDIFFTISSETPDEVGMSSVWLSQESNVYLNSFCFGYRLNSESEGKVTHQFLGAQLRADHIRKQIILLAQGSTRFNISKAKLIEIPVYLPAIQEQQKIADFLSMLDVRIEQLSQKVELLKQQKKGLMQQMFI